MLRTFSKFEGFSKHFPKFALVRPHPQIVGGCADGQRIELGRWHPEKTRRRQHESARVKLVEQWVQARCLGRRQRWGAGSHQHQPSRNPAGAPFGLASRRLS